MQAHAEISVNYLVEYNEDNGECGGTNLAPVVITIPHFGTALNVMESAVSFGIEYQFEITFSKEGYMVDVLNGTRAKEPCYWVFYVLSPNVQELGSNFRVSSYHVADNYSVILRYEKIPPNTYTTFYTIEHPDPICTNYTSPSSISISMPIGSSALNVMELAVRDYGSSYGISVTYADTDSGYNILQINNLKVSSKCLWFAFVTPSGGTEAMLTSSVSLYIIPADGHTLTLRYKESVLHTSVPAAVTTSGTKVISFMC